MLEVITKHLANYPTREDKVHQLREFLQLIVLRIMSEGGYFQKVAFVGGTALRFLYQLERFSEDLDFSLTRSDGYDFEKMQNSLLLHLEKLALKTTVKSKSEKTVQTLSIRFEELLYDLQLSPLKNEKLSIRLEVDTMPPAGWKSEMTVINNIYIFPIWHFDLPSLFATKIHACFFRKFLKGRDYYDLMWYLSRKIQPNFMLLNNAIQQTDVNSEPLDENNFKQFLLEQLSNLDFKFIQNDVRPFLVSPDQVSLLEQDVFFNLIEKL